MNRAGLLLASAALLGGGLWAWSRSRPAGAGEGGQRIPADLFAGAVDAIEDAVAAVTPGPWAPPSRAAAYLATIAAAEDAHGIPRNLLARLLYQESHFRPEIIDGSLKSSAGALGIAQFMPATAAELGIDPLDPAQAIPAAADYLAKLYARFGTWREALAAYNFGQGNVAKGRTWPAETVAYVDGIAGDVGVA